MRLGHVWTQTKDIFLGSTIHYLEGFKMWSFIETFHFDLLELKVESNFGLSNLKWKSA